MHHPILKPVLDIVVALSALGTFLVAWAGVRTWRRQLRGQAEFESARQILLALRHLERAVANVRSPGNQAWERPEKYRSIATRRLAGVEEAEMLSHVHYGRWNDALVPATRALETHVEEMEVAVNITLDAETRALRTALDNLRLALDEYLFAVSVEEEEISEKHWAFYRAPGNERGDPTGDKIATAIRNLRDAAERHARKF